MRNRITVWMRRVFHNLPALHYKGNAVHHLDIGQWVAGNRNDVGEMSRLDGAKQILLAEQRSSVDRRGL